MRLRFVHLVRLNGCPDFDFGGRAKVIFWRGEKMIFCTMTDQKTALKLSLIIGKARTVAGSRK
ncbi:MAG: hypothetical protein COA81_05900 [Alphaproteobacteria bacterium]|nr:MAG: hypothetical protein COA81_05900 [Alphaproteobacteria bacterium]